MFISLGKVPYPDIKNPYIRMSDIHVDNVITKLDGWMLYQSISKLFINNDVM